MPSSVPTHLGGWIAQELPSSGGLTDVVSAACSSINECIVLGTIVSTPDNVQSTIFRGANYPNYIWSKDFEVDTHYEFDIGRYTVGRLRDVSYFNNYSYYNESYTNWGSPEIQGIRHKVINTAYLAVSDAGQVCSRRYTPHHIAPHITTYHHITPHSTTPHTLHNITPHHTTPHLNSLYTLLLLGLRISHHHSGRHSHAHNQLAPGNRTARIPVQRVCGVKRSHFRCRTIKHYHNDKQQHQTTHNLQFNLQQQQ